MINRSLLFFFFFSVFITANSEDILGCSGFVKSSVPIDFSKIEVSFLTSEGHLSSQTDVAPNNGYFIIPYVEKGKHIMRIDPPEGWIFEPMEVELEIDGETDACSRNQNINFHFKGFTLSGKVVNQHSTTPGPQGVHLTLMSMDDKVLATTMSYEGGLYQFKGVKPGSYKIQATHDSYILYKATSHVTVEKSNVDCHDDLVVSGYDVHGVVTSQGVPVEGVQFLLFSKTPRTDSMQGCMGLKPEGSPQSSTHPHFICLTSSDKDGTYVFATLPSSDYQVMPFHRGENIQFDLEPRHLDFEVTNKRVTDQQFQVVGFSVKGKVTNVKGGVAVSGADVFVDGKLKSTTDESGFYTLQNMNNGAYEVHVKKEHMQFEPRKLQVNTGTPQLPDISADRFSVCGSVAMQQTPHGYQPQQVQVAIGNQQRVQLDEKSQFCFYVAPGIHSVETKLPDTLVKQGIALQPSNIKVEVVDGPVFGVDFSQYRANVRVNVKCIDGCQGTVVTMTNSGSNKMTQTLEEGETFASFQNVLPGDHVISIQHADWCWKEEGKTLKISHEPSKEDDGPLVVDFEQSGFLLACSLSHDADVDIELDGKVAQTVAMKKKESKLCLSRVGIYKLVPKSCHNFDDSNDKLLFDTSAPKKVVMTSQSHTAVFEIQTTRYEEFPQEILANVKLNDDQSGVEKIFSLDEEKSTEETLVYTLVYLVESDKQQQIEVTPLSSVLLFTPKSSKVSSLQDSCAEVLQTFEGRVGKFIRGSVQPAVEGVEISIRHNSDVIVRVVTGEDGTYNYGPLDPSNDYDVTASLKDHSLMPIEGQPGSFAVKKFSKIVFQVQMEGGAPLGGVLLAVSGENYQGRSLSDHEGKLTISKLDPGQYYFKAAMKEYKFTPASQVVDIEEGKEKVIQIVGKRTAFSCYGNVTSLNNSPVGGVQVRATAASPQDGAKTCPNAKEDLRAKSDDEGKFVVKGLLPGCDYDVTVVESDDLSHVLPSDGVRMSVRGERDIDDVTFRVFRSSGSFRLSGFVQTERKNLPFIKVAVYSTKDASKPLQVAKMSEQSPFFNLQIDGEKHEQVEVRLESTLPRSSEAQLEQNVDLKRKGNHQHLTFHFRPSEKQAKGENVQTSLASLPLTIILIVLFFNSDTVFGILQNGMSFFKSEKSEQMSTKSGKKSRN